MILFLKRISSVFLLGILLMPSSVFALESNDLYYYQWAYEDIGLYEAWDYTVGSSDVIVAIIDNGFDSFHPDLKANLWWNKDEIRGNGIDDDKNGYVDDIYGWNFYNNNNNPRPQVENLTQSERNNHIFSHGTMIAGLIGGVGDNLKDGVGINWHVKLMNLKVLGNLGAGSLSTIDDAIRYAVDNGADIINISMVGYYTEDMEKAIDYAYDNDVLIVAAAGNNSYSLNDNALYPVCMDADSEEQKILGVSAVNKSHHLTIFSNTGSECIDITAPGANVSSTVRFSPTNGLSDRYLGGWQGTSFAAPMVSGVAALIKSLQPDWTPKEIIDTLLSTVHHTPNDDEEGYAELFGAGLLQANEAVKYATGFITNDKDFEHILTYSQDGLTWDQKLDSYGFEEKKDFLSNIQDAAVYKESGVNLFVTIKNSTSKGQSEVLIKNKLGDQISGWRVPVGDYDSEYNIAVGNVYGDSEVEVILVPKDSSKILFKIFSLNGKFLSEVKNNKKHKGVSVDLFKKTNNKYDIVIYFDDGDLKVQKYSGRETLLKNLEIKHFEEKGDLVTGDIDGDGKDEYVLTGGDEDGPFLLFLESDGRYRRKFSVYDFGYKGLLNIDMVDYNKDGKQDVAVYSKKGDQPAKVWTYRAKKLLEWKPFNGVNMADLELLAY